MQYINILVELNKTDSTVKIVCLTVCFSLSKTIIISAFCIVFFFFGVFANFAFNSRQLGMIQTKHDMVNSLSKCWQGKFSPASVLGVTALCGQFKDSGCGNV